MGDWLHALGIPEDKIVPVPNAPGFPLDPAQAESLQQARRDRPPGRLRALFLGRLDAQKGLQRLAEVIAQSRDLPVDWRVIGKAVLADGPLPEAISAVLEPALTTPEALTEALAAADVLVLLSEYEGLPLTVLEAMRQGVVPVATDVGAVAEVVQDGVTGVLLPFDQAVPACLAALRALTPDHLARLSANAAAAMQGRDWLAATAPLALALDRIAATRQPSADTDLPPPAHVAPLGAHDTEMERIDLTPPLWAALQSDEPARLHRYEPFAGFLQFGAPEGADVVLDLQPRRLRGQGRALSLTPEGRPQPWFTYELILDGAPLQDLIALDFRLRYALPRPRNLYAQFMLSGAGEQVTIDFGTLRGTDAGSPMTLTLALRQVAPEMRRSLARVRLVLSTDGEMLPLDLMEFSVEGRR